MASSLSSQFKTKLNLQTKTVGEDRIKRAKERNEDVAILSMELPGENKPFKCCLEEECFMGDPNTLPLGIYKNQICQINHDRITIAFYHLRIWR